MKPSLAFATFVAKYPPKPMRIEKTNKDEIRQMASSDGLQILPEAPADVTVTARINIEQLPQSEDDWAKNRHLWVVEGAGNVPFALEVCAWGVALESEKLKHSNLTGGGPACTGGEIWFVDKDSLVINANSGRYGAETETELNDAAEGFARCGYRVASMGFDIDNKRKPNSILIGPPRWIEPSKIDGQ